MALSAAYVSQRYVSTDIQYCSCIAGRFAGEDALAAVGASYPITVIFMAFAVGTNLGASVVVSRLFGAKDMVRMKSAVSTAFIACAFMSFFLTFIGYFFCGSMMRLVHTPENIFADGRLYLKIYVYGITFLLLYNVCTGIFTALGDSKTPLYFLIGSSVGNIILDYYFVASVGLGVAGVAWATFIAQGISAILALTFLAVRLKRINCEGTFKWLDLVLLAQIAAIAIPSIMQQSVLSIGNMFVQEIVNRYGSAVIAGYSGAIKLNTFAINSFMALGSCLSSYTAQNLGAGKKERLSMGFRTGIRLSLIAAIPFVALYFFASRQMMGLFLNKSSTDAINAGREFLHIVSPMYFMISIKLMTDGIIRGAGAMHYFVMATVPDLILRILVALLLTKYFGSTGIWMAWPFGWIAATVLTIIFYRRIIFGKYVIRL
jgi:putative MATE family efflux protein